MPIAITPEWSCVLDAKANVGEVPIWSARSQRLYWIDIYAPSLNRTDPLTGATQTWRFTSPIGSYALDADEAFALVALQEGYFKLDLRTGASSMLFAAPYDVANYRFNDGRCDRQGRFWVGTARLRDSTQPDGGASFYRLDAQGPVRLIEGVTIANGIAWSPDGRTMYLADRPNWQMLAFDYDPASGVPSNRRRFAGLNVGEIPDGAVVDSEGFYWIALMDAGKILRFSPAGELDRILEAPTLQPTMITFGGHDYRTLFVTTAAHDRGSKEAAAERLAGGIFSLDLDVRGIPEPRVKWLWG
ncbi:SMP-30/gluconolactonase/LRE family protein [Ramlibacter sp.]|uniref:SMP-30/gluconolactonase/LRE family protein n=1 Tax=Ramlibacter sp. TaxID=1917967 RepID=UPI003D11B934